MTTAACFTADALGDMRRAAHVGSRIVLFATLAERWVGPGSGPTLRSTGRCLLEYEHVAQAALVLGPHVSVVPAIGSQFAALPRLVVALHELVCRRGGRLALCLDSNGEHAMQFHDAYGCSGVALL
ncbi:hypothetical protein [Burkholderia sp. WAC0059]|uniref:hypothetical protein n=1 Tax=Burkholderia sp. WAC0059 TaxID=2066022 RepID=UPI0015E1264D|nr:hypothetical protein [Burkholderia sp. WAC0059]